MAPLSSAPVSSLFQVIAMLPKHHLRRAYFTRPLARTRAPLKEPFLLPSRGSRARAGTQTDQDTNPRQERELRTGNGERLAAVGGGLREEAMRVENRKGRGRRPRPRVAAVLQLGRRDQNEVTALRGTVLKEAFT